MKAYDFGYRTLEQVVERVNDGAVQGFEEHTSEFLAASYAYDAAKEGSDSLSEIDSDTIETHLEFLRDAGADFQMANAVAKGMRLVFDNGIFGRSVENGVLLCWNDSGEAVTRLEKNMPLAWPAGSDLSAHYEHPEGVVLSREDAGALGIEIE